MNTARAEAMDRAINDLWRLYRAAADYAGRSGIDDVLYTARQSLAALEELQGAVLSNGGVHGSPDAAWEAWQDLAVSTGDALTAALGYGERWSLTGYMRAAGQVVLDTADNIASGAAAGLTTINLIALAVGLYFVAQIVRGGRGIA